MRTIKGKMLFWFGSGIILVLVALGIIMSGLIRHAVIPAIQDSGEQIVSANAKEIGHWVQSHAEFITNMSRLRVFREGSLEEIQSFLASQEDLDNQDFELLLYADVNGDYYSKAGYLGNLSFRGYFQELVTGKTDAVVTNALTSNSTGKPVFVIAHSVMDQSSENSNKLKGVIAATISLDTLSSISDRVQIDAGGYGWVADGSGLVIAHPDPEMRMNFNVLYSKEQNFRGLDTTGKRMIAGFSGVGDYTASDATNMITIYHSIPNTPKWSLALSISRDDWMRRADDLSQKIFLLMTSILVVIFVLINLLSNVISKPLSLAVNHLNTISKGDFSKHIPYKYLKGKDEISDLTKGIESMQNSIESLMERTQYLAYFDVLTGLPNRIKFVEIIDMLQKEKGEEVLHLGVLLLDVDNFKDVNDTKGYYFGNKLLNCLSGIVQKVILKSNKTCELFKHDADQFLILIHNITGKLDLEKLAAGITKALEQPLEIKDYELYITVSMGGAVYPDHSMTGEVLIQKADMAMKASKTNGKNRYTLYEESMNLRITMRLDMEKSLRKGLARHEFLLMYQPVVQAGTGIVKAAEALIRWNHPQKGLILPAEFIPLAEESGLIDYIGEWVLREACMQNKEWQDKGFAPVNVAVNVSARQLQKKSFIPRLKKVLKETGLPPRYLTLELTESVFMDYRHASLEILESLRYLGVMLAIDDFGTGFSSFGYLKNLPVNILKMDKTFVRDIETDRERALTDAIILLGHKLHLDVTAEGIETAAQADYLISQGCDFLQGYLYSEPVPAPVLEKYLTTAVRLETHSSL
jgi:diguanylate cyclase (GGDEF)-like protein